MLNVHGGSSGTEDYVYFVDTRPGNGHVSLLVLRNDPRKPRRTRSDVTVGNVTAVWVIHTWSMQYA